MKKYLLLIVFFLIAVSFTLFSSEKKSLEMNVEKSAIEKQQSAPEKYVKYLAAALAITAATISSGIAIGKIGSAAMGAVSEKPEAGGTAIILAALAEGVCLWGFLVAFFILQ